MENKKRGLTKRQTQAMETKKTLFKTALKLFAKYGYDQVTIDDIVKKSGTSKGSFYTHFKSKDQIMLDQFKENDIHYEKWLKDSAHSKESATDQLLSFVQYTTNYISNALGIDILKVVYTNQISVTNTKKMLTDEKRPTYTIFYQIIKQGQESGEFRSDIPDWELTRLVSRWIRALLYDWCIQDGNFDLNAEGQRYFRWIVDFLKKGAAE
jgi:AcrR family transcriptional regulator